MNAQEFNQAVEKLIQQAREDGLDDETVITELDGIVEALKEGLT